MSNLIEAGLSDAMELCGTPPIAIIGSQARQTKDGISKTEMVTFASADTQSVFELASRADPIALLT